jgi:hypothetical protein
MAFAVSKMGRSTALVPHQSPNSGAFRLGQKVVVVRKQGHLENATIRYIGETKFYSGVTWYGVELQACTGKNNGSVHGERYFRCKMGHGLFVRREMISHTGWGRQTTSLNAYSGVADDPRMGHGLWIVDDLAAHDSQNQYESPHSGVRGSTGGPGAHMWAPDDSTAAARSARAAASTMSSFPRGNSPPRVGATTGGGGGGSSQSPPRTVGRSPPRRVVGGRSPTRLVAGGDVRSPPRATAAAAPPRPRLPAKRSMALQVQDLFSSHKAATRRRILDMVSVLLATCSYGL